MKSFFTWLSTALSPKEPTPEENVQLLRRAARRVYSYSPRISNNLSKMADAEEQRLKERS